MDEVTAGGPRTAAPAPLSHKEIVTILIGLMMGMFLAALDQTIVASAMRVIADDLNDLAGQAWVTTAYLITATITTPLYGKLGDIYGRKKLFLFAITIFTIGSMLCTFAGRSPRSPPSAPCRASAPAVSSRSPSRSSATSCRRVSARSTRATSSPSSAPRASSVRSSAASSPTRRRILGITGWRWVFLVNVPIAIAALIVVTRTLHLKHTRLDHRVDYWGAAALIVTLVPLLIVAEQGREWGWGSADLDRLLRHRRRSASSPSSSSSARWPRRRSSRCASSRTAPSPRPRSASVFIGMGMFGGLAALPLYLQIVKGSSADRRPASCCCR